jgi:hypothetical protein
MRNGAGRLSLAALVGVAFFVAAESSSRAESAPLPTVCEMVLAPDGDSIPANAPALVARQRRSNATIMTIKVVADPPWPGTFTFVDDDRHIGAKLLVPSEALPAGTEMTVELALDCGNLTGTAKTTFTPADPAPLPTTIGVGKGIAKIEPSAELVKFLPVTKLEAKIGDTVYGLTSYGELAVDGNGLLDVPIGNVPTGVLCADDERSDKTMPIELHAHVAGATEDPELIVVDVAVTCRPRVAGASSPTDAGPDTETTVRDDAGGCAAAPNAPASVWLTFAIGAALVVASRRIRGRAAPRS